MAKFGHYLLLAAILTLAAYFRFQGLDWDQGYLFHPDERQILFVTTRLDLPANPLEFFSADSALNPKFFAYGSFPIYLLKALAIFAPATNFPIPWEDNRLVSYALLGRALSALFDLGTVALIFFLGRRLYTARVGLLAAAGVAVTVLNIQLSHFYTVDTILTFFILATIYFAARYAETARPRDQIALSVAFGLALATKISAVPLIAPIIFATIKANSLLNKEHPDLIVDKSISLRNSQFAIRNSLFAWRTRISNARAELRKIFFISLAVFFITQPYALLDPIRFIGQTGTEALIARGWLDVPFTRQYSDTLPYAYAIAQSSVWGMGLPLGLVAWIGAGFFLWRWWRAREWRDGFILAWALIYFFAIGGQSAKHLRYLLPLIPFFYLMAAHTISNFKFRIPNYFFRIAFVVALLAAFVYSLAFVGIYSREHPYSAISRWIYQNIPRGATIAIEHWDDQLPLSIRAAETNRAPIEYQEIILPLFDPDDDAKLKMLADSIAASDYIILASQRLYATIPRLGARYPFSARYYSRLFNGDLGFDLAAFARNDPELGGIVIADNALTEAGLTIPPPLANFFARVQVWAWGKADESFTVYDHPMPLVFKKNRAVPRDELLRLIAQNF